MGDIELSQQEIIDVLARHFTVTYGQKATVQLINGRDGEHLGLVKFIDLAWNRPLLIPLG